MALGGVNPKQDKPRRLQLGPLLISHSQQMRSCKSTARCFSFIYWCYKAIFNSTFDPPASLCIGRSASLMFTEAAAGRWIISAGQLFSALCHAGAGQPAKPSPCHLLRLPHEVPGCWGRDLVTPRGDTGLLAAAAGVPEQGQVRRALGLDTWLAASRCPAQGELPFLLSARKTIK